MFFLTEHGILKDQERAAKYFQLAADQIEQKYQADKRELLEQHYKSGLRMYRGRGDSEDWAGAARIFKELSDTVGHARSQYFLAEMFRYGRGGLPRDSCESERYYKLSADQGVCLAQFEFAKILNRRGKLHESVRYHRRAADGGILEAQYEFAGKLMRGVSYGVEVILPKSPEEAVRYYERAAHRRHKRAQHALGRIFLIGEGVPQNKLEAERYFRMAANQGNTDSQHNLGRMLYYGDGIPKNKAEGRRYLKMARKSFGGKHLKRRMYY